MDETELRARIRELLSSGRIPRVLPTAAGPKGSGAVSEPRILVGVQPAEHCSLCGEVGPVVSYTYPDGRVIRMHALCNIVWDDERERA